MVRLLRILLIVITLYAIPCLPAGMRYTLYDLYAKDRIIAIVNNEVITQKDLNDFINFMRMQLSQEYKGEELESKIQSMKLDLMDRLVEDRLILQEAKRVLEEAKINKNARLINQLDVDQNRIKAKINEIKKRYPLDAEFQNALSQQGLTQADIELKIKEQLLMYNIIETNVKNKIIVNPAEVTDFYQKNIEKFKTAEQRQVSLITINDAKTANDIDNKLKETQDFSDIINKYSLKVEKISVQQNKELRKDIEDAIFKLNIGEISAPIKADDTFYIFRLDNIVAPKQENLPEVQDRIYAFIFDTKMQEELAKWLDGLKAQAYIKILPD